MKSVLRMTLAVIAGMAVAFVLVLAVEWFGAMVHPFPADFDGNIGEHVKRYPDWALAVVVLAWSATGAAGTWVASRIGNRITGGAVALLLAWGLIFNLASLPYTMWFKAVMLASFAAGCLIGIRSGPAGTSRAGGRVRPT